jgi:hypothetical protein
MVQACNRKPCLACGCKPAQKYSGRKHSGQQFQAKMALIFCWLHCGVACPLGSCLAHCVGRPDGHSVGSVGTLCQAIWPFFNIYSLAASSVFSIPFWRHFVAWIGAVPATSGNFKKLLSKGSVAVIVGGIAGV